MSRREARLPVRPVRRAHLAARHPGGQIRSCPKALPALRQAGPVEAPIPVHRNRTEVSECDMPASRGADGPLLESSASHSHILRVPVSPSRACDRGDSARRSEPVRPPPARSLARIIHSILFRPAGRIQNTNNKRPAAGSHPGTVSGRAHATPGFSPHSSCGHQAKCAKALLASAMRCTFSRVDMAAPSRRKAAARTAWIIHRIARESWRLRFTCMGT